MVADIERQRVIVTCVCSAVMLLGMLIIFHNHRMRVHAIDVERAEEWDV